MSVGSGVNDGQGAGVRRRTAIDLPPATRPHLFVVVDTEEEFDWSTPPRRTSTGVTAMRHVERGQRIFDTFGIRPTYVIDYPIASHPDGYLPLVDIHRSNRCSIGAHTHPWVNPPEDEELSSRNTFMCNLPVPLQRAKLERLCGQIAARFGIGPTVYKAGRYGIGTSTIPLLEELGFEVDASVCPRFDYSREGGPTFAEFDARPFFVSDRLLEIPCTVDYVGHAGALRPWLHRVASRDSLAAFRGVGILARLGLTNRVMLSPEGNTLDEMRALTDSLLARGVRAFTLSFHSPSLDVGHTPYVRSQAALDRFLNSIERFCEFFIGERNGVASTPGDFRAVVMGQGV